MLVGKLGPIIPNFEASLENILDAILCSAILELSFLEGTFLIMGACSFSEVKIEDGSYERRPADYYSSLND